jgi:prepilin-type N-terminal cleavage/methylation domain-containing protein
MNDKMASLKRAGFTLVELAVVIVIIGVLAAFAVPKFRQAVERAKAGEAFNYLAAIRSSEERYASQEGSYASNIANDLDINMSTLKYFTVGTVAAGNTGSLEDSWSLALTRNGAAAAYGNYTVIFTDDGYDSVNSTINTQINPMQQ